jgi:hypothetical protein
VVSPSIAQRPLLVFWATDRAVRGHPPMRERSDGPNAETRRKISLQHSVAAAFLHGADGLAQYEVDCVADAAVRAARKGCL